jgi:hypothetical protein
MIQFVLGWRAAGGIDAAPAADALAGVTAREGFLDPARLRRWRSPDGHAALAWVAHTPAQLGGVEYVHAEDRRLAMFAGRPVRWDAAGREADGAGPLDPRAYLEPSAAWRDALDGRWAAARYDDAARELEVGADALGAYPLFTAEAHGARWFSNAPAALASLTRARELDPLALAGLLGGGWSPAGDPLWSAVRRLPRGTVVRLRADGGEDRGELLGDAAIVSLLGAGFDAAAAADGLVAGLRALADWPGRPSLVPVTGGRDSRLILAGALRAGFPFTTTTGGATGTPDVEAGRALARAAGVEHELLGSDPHGDMYSEPERAAEVVALLSAGTACLADAAGFPLGPAGGPLPLWHSGQGGEIARGYYGPVRRMGRRAPRGELVERMYGAFTGRRPGREAPLNPTGARLVREHLHDWVEHQLDAGAAPADVPDLFYLERRMATWAGPSHGCVEPVKDTTSALWSHRLLAHELGASTAERGRELFALRVLERLAPELVEVPFADGRPWPARQSGVARRAHGARVLTGKAAAELTRRARARSGPRDAPGAGEPADSFGRVHELVRDRVLDQPDHPAWAVLDRPRVERLLGTAPRALDVMSRYYVWRLATVFLVDEYASAGVDPDRPAAPSPAAVGNH